MLRGCFGFPDNLLCRTSICIKFATKQICGLFWLRTNNFFSPFSPFFCSSKRSLMLPTFSGASIAWWMVRRWFVSVKHSTSSSVKAYALPNRFLWWFDNGALLTSVWAHSIPRHPAYRLHSVQLAIAASRQQSSGLVFACWAM